MKNLKYLIPLILLGLMISCTPSKMEVWVNEDGSGKSTVSINMGEFIDMLKPMLESLGESIENDTLANNEENQNFVFGDSEDMDSTVVMYDIMPDSIKRKFDHPEYMKNIIVHIQSNKADQMALMQITINFDNSAHYNAIKEELLKMSDGEGPALMGNPQDDIGSFFEDFQIDMKNKVIIMPESNLPEDFAQNEEMQVIFEKIDSLEFYPEDSMERMMVEMLVGSDMEIIINAPGKVVSCSNESAEIDGHAVKYTQSIIDLIKKGAHDAVVVKWE